ncbi:MAG TPA: hypothetical protein VES69_02325, partial [Pyrinomonadaceae bacterium]|nr:hypothetical protein [Pyrinomonadaceae bacterium]
MPTKRNDPLNHTNQHEIFVSVVSCDFVDRPSATFGGGKEFGVGVRDARWGRLGSFRRVANHEIEGAGSDLSESTVA